MESKMINKTGRFVRGITIAIIAVILASIALGFGFNEANSKWNLKAYAKKVEIVGKPYDQDELKIRSYNVRIKSGDLFGNKRWGIRFPYILENISSYEPDVIAVQEVEKSQEKDLSKYLNGYDSVVIYRDKSIAGEAVGVYFRKDRFEKHSNPKLSGGFWLSETPEKMSKGWDASAYRICTFVTLVEKDTGYIFTVFSTHLDHKGKKAPLESIELMNEKVEELKKLQVENFILIGDFNFDEKSSEYDLSKTYWDNAKYYPETVERVNEGRTFNGYESRKSQSDEAIDHVFYVGNMESYRYGRLERVFNGIYPSDHFPVVVNFKK